MWYVQTLVGSVSIGLAVVWSCYMDAAFGGLEIPVGILRAAENLGLQVPPEVLGFELDRGAAWRVGAMAAGVTFAGFQALRFFLLGI